MIMRTACVCRASCRFFRMSGLQSSMTGTAASAAISSRGYVCIETVYVSSTAWPSQGVTSNGSTDLEDAEGSVPADPQKHVHYGAGFGQDWNAVDGGTAGTKARA